MVRVKIAVRGPLAARLSSSPVELEVDDGASVGSVLKQLLAEYQQVRAIWSDVEQMDRDSLIVCNNIDIGLSGGLDTRLNNNDTIAIIPLVHGG